ncbi:hypothetical protein [Candidatus Nanohalococcus occultus]|uniref:hypothetical protein n=1 Tax=Candidatus Nanohalococcus occultus TaxID=2978047 RepID=UPI0039E0514C
MSVVTGLIAAGGHNPEDAAQKSDAVIYGAVSSISESGEVTEHHPVKIDVIDAFKGNKTELLGRNLSNTVTVQVKGTERMDVSTAADFTEGEEVVVMLEEQGGRYYMTTGYATKYEVSNNDTLQLVAPERKNITVAEMESMVENSTTVSHHRRQENNSSGNSVTDEDIEFPWTAHLNDFLEDVYSLFKNL